MASHLKEKDNEDSIVKLSPTGQPHLAGSILPAPAMSLFLEFVIFLSATDICAFGGGGHTAWVVRY